MNSNLISKLNLQKPKKSVKSSGKSTIEKEINSIMQEACLEAIKSHPKLKEYLIENLPKSDVFKQVKDDNGTKTIEMSTIEGEVIAIPTSNVKLTNGTKHETLDTAFKVGVIATYINGIKKQIIEYIPTK